MIYQNMSTTKDQFDEEIPQCGSRCAIKADRQNRKLEPNGSESKLKKLPVGLFGFFLVVLPFVLVLVMAWTGATDSATHTTKQAESRRKLQENAEANAEACDLCSEANFTTTVDELFATFISNFEYLRQLIGQASDELDAAGSSDMAAMLSIVGSNVDTLLATVTSEDIEEFYSYYLVRYFYGSLGAQTYLDLSQEFGGGLLEQCYQFGSLLNLTCPSLDEMDLETAKQHLWSHADNVFSSICTSGFPTPLWSEPDGSGSLLVANNQTQTLHPVSGSGINMSAPMKSLNDYFSLTFWGNKVDLTSVEWKDKVEANPLYSWLMSSLTPAKEGTVCGNGNLTGLNTGIEMYDKLSADMINNMTEYWCDSTTIPNEENPGTGDYTKQHFAKMWYGLLARSIGEKAEEVDSDGPWNTCCSDLLVGFGAVPA